tara:strand:- start:46 stop:507 length:462 start_codon:yes stop_codon:yes gene_type:complete
MSIFIGGTGSANELDDYEEGIFTPSFTCTSGSIGVHTSYDTLAYTKIGRLVHVTGQLVLTNSSSNSGNIVFNGLPFAGASLSEVSERAFSLNIGYFNGSSPAGSNHFIFQLRVLAQGSTTALMQGIAPNDDGSIADWCANGTDLWFNFTYFAA